MGTSLKRTSSGSGFSYHHPRSSQGSRRSLTVTVLLGVGRRLRARPSMAGAIITAPSARRRGWILGSPMDFHVEKVNHSLLLSLVNFNGQPLFKTLPFPSGSVIRCQSFLEYVIHPVTFTSVEKSKGRAGTAQLPREDIISKQNKRKYSI